jgi:hypothetical protein
MLPLNTSQNPKPAQMTYEKDEVILNRWVGLADILSGAAKVTKRKKIA